MSDPDTVNEFDLEKEVQRLAQFYYDAYWTSLEGRLNGVRLTAWPDLPYPQKQGYYTAMRQLLDELAPVLAVEDELSLLGIAERFEMETPEPVEPLDPSQPIEVKTEE